MNLIKQITIGDGSVQTIKMVVRSNERGPQGLRGEEGEAATLEAGNVYSIPEGQTPQVINTGTSSNAVFDFYLPKGPKGEDGAIHYTAGTGINITDGNVIEATGAATATWGGIQGDIDDQTDLKTALQNTASTAETASKNYTDTQLAGYAKTTDIPTVNNATLTIQNNGTNVATFTANSSTNTTANIVPPVQIGSVLSTPTNVDYVNTANIVNGAVTNAKLANNAVDTANVINGAITANKLDFSTFAWMVSNSFATPDTNTTYYGDDITVPATGSYMAFAQVRTAATNNAGVLFVYLNINDSSANFMNTQFTTSNSARVSGDITTSVNLNAGDKIRTGFYGTSGFSDLADVTAELFLLRYR